MKCPLTIKTEYLLPHGVVSHGADCLQEECHWWSQKYGRCAILGYLEVCERATKLLADIAGKIPPGGAG